MPGFNKEMVEHPLEESEEEDERLRAFKKARWTSEAIFLALMPSSLLLVSMNSKNFNLLVARTMRKLYKDKHYI